MSEILSETKRQPLQGCYQSFGDDHFDHEFRPSSQIKIKFEATKLYALISRASRVSLRNAWRVVGELNERDVKLRSDIDQSTYLHHLVNQAPEVYNKYGDVNALIPLIYRLAICGVNVCAQNSHGNTCLHLACLRPHADLLCQHLIRIGVDPCIQNNKGCRVIHTYRHHVCRMVKGQKTAPSGIWQAVENEDLFSVERLLRSWCRVNIRKNKTLRELAEETSNVTLTRLLDRYEATNELVAAAFACDTDRVRLLLRRSKTTTRTKLRQQWAPIGTERDFITCTRSTSSTSTLGGPLAPAAKHQLAYGEVDLTQFDEAWDIPKPLVVSLSELGSSTSEIIEILIAGGAEGNSDQYREQLVERRASFEDSEFYRLIELGTDDSLTAAISLVTREEFDVELRGNSPQRTARQLPQVDSEKSLDEASKETIEQNFSGEEQQNDNWTYLHLVVARYLRMKSSGLEERSRLLIRLIYRLALAGIDINARDSLGRTALVLAASAASPETPTPRLSTAPSSARDLDTCRDVDQALITHLLRIGCDSSLTDSTGRAVCEEVYTDRGKLVFGRRYRQQDLPGLWVAVRNGDKGRVERWLSMWSRVQVTQADRRLVEVATSLGQYEIARLLEAHEHINEFVCATFACDLSRMMEILALGGGKRKVNTCNDYFLVGFDVSRQAEFIRRPIIVSALELCTPEVIDFLLNFGADLAKPYDESLPFGPVAFWAMRNHVSNENALVVARHTDVTLRNELGMTLLHAAVAKQRNDPVKRDVIWTLLSRGVNVAARDFEGSTARDYVAIFKVEDGSEIRKLIDNHVLELVNSDQFYRIETLLIDSYDHLMDIRGTKRNKTALEIADLKQFNQLARFLIEHDKYRNEIDRLQDAVASGDLSLVSRNSGEKRCSWARDKAGRTLLHNAVLYDHPEIVRFLVEQYPHLINARDNLNRTPLHYCVCLKNRHLIWPVLNEGGADPKLLDVNNLTAHDYVRELESQGFQRRSKAHNSRQRRYKVSELIESERTKLYGLKATSYALFEWLTDRLAQGASCSIRDFKAFESEAQFDLSIDSMDVELLRKCVELKRQEFAICLIRTFNCRPHLNSEMGFDDDDTDAVNSFAELAHQLSLNELANFLRSNCVGQQCFERYVTDEEVDTTLDEHEKIRRRFIGKSASLHTCHRPEVVGGKPAAYRVKRFGEAGPMKRRMVRPADPTKSSATHLDKDRQPVESDSGQRLSSSVVSLDNKRYSDGGSNITEASLALDTIKLVMTPSQSTASDDVDASLIEPHLKSYRVHSEMEQASEQLRQTAERKQESNIAVKENNQQNENAGTAD